MKKRTDLESFKFHPACRNRVPTRVKSMRGGYHLWALQTEKSSITGWKVPLRQRIGLLFHGRLWLECLGRNQPAVALHCKKSIIKEEKK